MTTTMTTRLLLIAAMCSIAGLSHAQIQPTNTSAGVVIDTPTAGVTNITAPDNAVVNYSKFDVASGQTVNFIQPGVAARVLNRINSATPTQIDGNINANGVVYFVNPSGVTFGPNSVVNAAGIYAAAASLCDCDFLKGFDVFTDVSGDVNLQGTVNADIIAAFVGRNVVNAGDISVPCGTVVLASGKKVLIGSPLGGLMVQVGAQTGGFDGSVSNQGNIKARQTTLISRDLYSVVIDPETEYHGNNKPGIDIDRFDIDGDGDIDQADIQTAMDNYTGPLAPGTGTATQQQGDTDGDGDVDNNDIGTLFVYCTGPLAPPPPPPSDPPTGPFNFADIDYVERLPALSETVNLTEADLGILSDQLGIAVRDTLPSERIDKLQSRGVYDDYAARNSVPASPEGVLVIANARLDADVVRQALTVYRERLAAEGVSPIDRSTQIKTDVNNAYDNYVSVQGDSFDAEAFSSFVQTNNPALFDNMVALFELKRLTLNMGLNDQEKQNSERAIIERSRPAQINYDQMKSTLDASGELAQRPDENEQPVEREADEESAES